MRRIFEILGNVIMGILGLFAALLGFLYKLGEDFIDVIKGK